MEQPRILVTKSLQPDQLKLADRLGLMVELAPMLHLETIPGVVEKAWERPYDGWIVSSQQAVRAIEQALPPTSLNCPVAAVGPKTGQGIRDLGFPLALQASHAKDLAASIISANWRRVAFLAGDPHRPELPALLRQAEVAVDIYLVYRSSIRAISQTLTNFHAVLLFSPRGVQGLLAQQPWPQALSAFAIGPTTAQAFADCTGQSALYPDTPTVEQLLTLVSHHLVHHPPHV